MADFYTQVTAGEGKGYMTVFRATSDKLADPPKNWEYLKKASKPRAAKGQKNGLTPAGRKRLSELMKQRWAERRKKAASAKK
jgi:hypothetical protein